MNKKVTAPEIVRYDGKRHAAGVSYLARQIANTMGLPLYITEDIGHAGYCHDIGKEYLPAALWDKPGKLTDEEYERMKQHTRLGFEVLRWSEFQRFAAQAALEHHEKWDGSGYWGYKGENISLAGRIVAVADVYDALRTARPYRPAWDCGRIIGYMESERNRSFDTEVVDALLHFLKQERAQKSEVNLL